MSRQIFKTGYLARRQRRKKKVPPRSATQGLLLKQVVIGTLITLTLIGIIVGVWYGSRIESLQIKIIEVVGSKTIPEIVVQAVIEEVLAGDYFKVVPYRFALTLPDDAVIAAVLNIPRVKEVRIERIKDQILTVAFTEYDPVALWCAELATSCVFLDSSGYAFAPAPALMGNAFIRYQNGVVPTVGTAGFSEPFMTDSQFFSQQLETNLGLFVQGVEIKDDIDISYVLTTGAKVKTSTRMEAFDSLANLESILTNDAFLPLADGDFHYIDLRFGDRVFVSETEVLATSSDMLGEGVLEIIEAEE